MNEIDENEIATEIVPAPWKLRASSLIFLDRVLDERGKTRFGVRAFVCYAQSPVGAYNEMATAILTIRGPRVTQMPVTLRASMISGRANWGFPKTLEEIEYSKSARRVVVGFRGRTIRARISRFSFPLKMRGFTVQTLDSVLVRVPICVEGRAHFAFAGKRFGVFLEDFALTVFAPEHLR